MKKAFNFVLNIDLSKAEESERLSNQSSLERFSKLSANGYKFFLEPKNNRKGEAYLWIIATKKGEDREVFSLYVNEQILNYVIIILTGRNSDISCIDADNLNSFNEVVKNFELELYMAERTQGKTMKNTHTTTVMTITSHYKNGVIVYRPYKNPELKAYLNA
ncbi:hypothetical protein [Dysgonomonas sp. 520]|uniref:hypothetical protein n=1 Tax=Dysgonomonas sp. 520 TaxID=2302931 RepID=UPI0013D64B50|nr:hypothetical protein [Dysgonomonas sp. 520]NDW09423.1 hypothetical protein [Dysgonomonas sp. 520]